VLSARPGPRLETWDGLATRWHLDRGLVNISFFASRPPAERDESVQSYSTHVVCHMMIHQSSRCLSALRVVAYSPSCRFSSAAAAAVTPALVKALREKSGAPMMDCKKALAAPEVNGDLSKARDWLRAKGMAKMANSADRVALEGLIATLTSGDKITLLEINSETGTMYCILDRLLDRYIRETCSSVNGFDGHSHGSVVFHVVCSLSQTLCRGIRSFSPSSHW
jgi:hypothetical protein